MALSFPDVTATGRGTAAARRLPAAPVQLLRSGYEYAVFFGLLALFGVSSLVWSLVAAVLSSVLPRRLGQATGQLMLMAGCRYFVAMMQLSGIIECDLEALDVLRDQRSLVIAPNHPSLLDVVLVGSRLPHVVCAAKARLLRNWLFGGLARLSGFIRNDAPTRFVREAIRQLNAGGQLLIFPEGTRTTAATVDRFKGGFALIAKCAEAPVQTVFIDTNSPFLGKGWPLWRKPEFPLRYRVRLGAAFAVTGDVGEFVERLEAGYRDELARRS
jgi:1-acyl-sn-glycerol-3-phosphate acyltransferase